MYKQDLFTKGQTLFCCNAVDLKILRWASRCAQKPKESENKFIIYQLFFTDKSFFSAISVFSHRSNETRLYAHKCGMKASRGDAIEFERNNFIRIVEIQGEGDDRPTGILFNMCVRTPSKLD